MLIRLLRSYLGPYRWPTALVTGLLLVQSIANLYLPNLNADIINNGVAKADTDYIWRTGAVMLGVALLLGVLAVVAVYFASQVSMGVGRDLRSAVFARVISIRRMRRKPTLGCGSIWCHPCGSSGRSGATASGLRSESVTESRSCALDPVAWPMQTFSRFLKAWAMAGSAMAARICASQSGFHCDQAQPATRLVPERSSRIR